MNYEFEIVNCNICGSDNSQPICDEGKFGLPTHVVLCKECGLGYLNPRWNKESYLHFYKYEYDRYYRPESYMPFGWVIDKENLILKRLDLLDLAPETVENILDIGSGDGQNLAGFKSRFPKSKLYAIEPSLESQKELERNDVTIISDSVDTLWHEEIDVKFDVVIMRHVLEHFMNPVEVMTKINSVLSPSGIVYIAVPNNLKPIHNLKQSWFRNVHTYYFNKYSLKNLSNIAGLTILNPIEEDEFVKGEVYLIARKSESESTPKFSREHYLIQHSIFEQKFKHDKNIIFSAIRQLKKVAGKLSMKSKSKRH